MRYALFLLAATLAAQTTVKPAQLGAKSAGQLALIVVEPSGKANTAVLGSGLTVLPTQDGRYFLSCTYASGSIPKRATVKFEGQVGILQGMPRYLDVYRNGILMSPEDGDYSIQQVDGKTTITFADGQKLDPSDVIRAVFWM